MTITALATATLLVLCLRARPRVDSMLLLSAVITVAATDLVFVVSPGITGQGPVPYGFDARLVVGAIVPVAFAAAAFSSHSTKMPAGSRRANLAAIGCLVAVGCIEVLDLVIGRNGAGVGVSAGIVDLIDGCEAVVLLVAGGGVREPRSGGFRNGCWARPACCWPGYASSPSRCRTPGPTGSRCVTRCGWPPTGCSPGAAAIEWASLNRHRAESAMRAERERIARDIHDGLAQDLATILLHARSMEDIYGEEHPLAVAARRALAASRGTIEDPSAAEAPTPFFALRAVADELQSRHGIDVTVSEQRTTSDSGELSPRAREQAVRIAREAIVNAARHGHARHIEVSLSTNRSHWTLRVADDGLGLPEAVVAGATGFGMSAMRARATGARR